MANTFNGGVCLAQPIECPVGDVVCFIFGTRPKEDEQERVIPNPDPGRFRLPLPQNPCSLLFGSPDCIDDDDDDGCNPQEFRDWWNSLDPAPPGGHGASADYEARVARGIGTMGTTKQVPTGATTIQFGPILQHVNADGATSHNCRLIDAKFDGGGQYRVGDPPPWLVPGDDDDIELDSSPGELLRYRMAVISNPVVRALEIRTNTPEAQDFFRLQLPEYGFIMDVDAYVEHVR